MISRRLGFTKDVFSRIKTEKNYFGSNQLLAAMQILLELETLKRETKEFSGMRTAFQKFAGFGLNETANDEPKINSLAKGVDNLRRTPEEKKVSGDAVSYLKSGQSPKASHPKRAPAPPEPEPENPATT